MGMNSNLDRMRSASCEIRNRFKYICQVWCITEHKPCWAVWHAIFCFLFFLSTQWACYDQTIDRSTYWTNSVASSHGTRTQSFICNYSRCVCVCLSVRSTMDDQKMDRELPPAITIIYKVVHSLIRHISTSNVYEVIPIAGAVFVGRERCFVCGRWIQIIRLFSMVACVCAIPH